MRNILCVAAIVKRNENIQSLHLLYIKREREEKEKKRANDSFVPLATSPIFIRRYLRRHFLDSMSREETADVSIMRSS